MEAEEGTSHRLGPHLIFSQYSQKPVRKKCGNLLTDLPAFPVALLQSILKTAATEMLKGKSDYVPPPLLPLLTGIEASVLLKDSL